MSEAIFERDSAGQAMDRPALRHAPIRYPVGADRAGRAATTRRPRPGTCWSSPARLPRSSGCLWAWASPSCTCGGLRYWPGVLIGDLLANDYTALPSARRSARPAGTCSRWFSRSCCCGASSGMDRRWRASAASARSSSRSRSGGGASAPPSVPSRFSRAAWSTGDEVPTVWRTWWLGDATGALVVVPLALAWYRPLPDGLAPRGDRSRPLVLLAAVVGARPSSPRGATSPLMYLVFPSLIWAALRFGQRGATLAVATDRVLHRLEHDPLRRAVPLRVGHPQRAQHPALHRRRRTVDALSGRGRRRARAVRHAARRVPLAAHLGFGQRSPSVRARSPRRRAAPLDVAGASASRLRRDRQARADCAP